MILALAGLAGAGKTTAIELLEAADCGRRLYVGQFVTDEVKRRGLLITPENERLIRDELRQVSGMGALAQAALPVIEQLAQSTNVLIDAIYCEEERSIYLDRFGQALQLIAIHTPTELRARRIAERQQRSLSAAELTRRDEYEISVLGLKGVLACADHQIDNSGDLYELESTLQGMLARLG